MIPGPVELFATLAIALLFWGLPIAAAVWALLTLVRMRRLLEQIAARLDAMASGTEGR